mmetsp:Transcript_17209/g.48435  ORF Transcript_17209/g.48435 Transcript_17209/m.48435 type:complete len:283 (+) Transcript_17209:1112-1960(+)
MGQLLEHVAPPDEDAALGRHGRPHQHGRGGRQPQGTRAGHHHDVHGELGGQGQAGAVRGGQVGERAGVRHELRAQGEPEAEGGGGQAQDGEHEGPAHAVRQPLDGRLPRLRLHHGPADFGHHALAPWLDGLHQQGGVVRQSASDDRVPWPLGHRRGLAREQALVHRGDASQDHAVHGHAFAGEDPDDVPRPHAGRAHQHLLHPFAQAQPQVVFRASLGVQLQPSLGREQGGQRLEVHGGLGARPRLERLPEQDEGQEHHRLVEGRQVPARDSRGDQRGGAEG